MGLPAIGPVGGAAVDTPQHCKRIKLATNGEYPTVEWHANQVPVSADSAILTHNQGYIGLMTNDTNEKVKLLTRMVRFMINRFDSSFGAAVWTYPPHKQRFMNFFKSSWKDLQEDVTQSNMERLANGDGIIFTCSVCGVRQFKKEWYRKVAIDFAKLNNWPTNATSKVVLILTNKASTSGNNKKRFYRQGMCSLAVFFIPIMEMVGFVYLTREIVIDVH